MRHEPLPPRELVKMTMSDQSVQQAWDGFAAPDAVDNVGRGTLKKQWHRRSRRNNPPQST